MSTPATITTVWGKKAQAARRARNLFVAYTGGRIGTLYGPAQADRRAEILSAIAGQRIPKSRAGWNMFRRAVYELYGATGDCDVARERDLQRLCKGEFQTDPDKRPDEPEAEFSPLPPMLTPGELLPASR